MSSDEDTAVARTTETLPLRNGAAIVRNYVAVGVGLPSHRVLSRSAGMAGTAGHAAGQTQQGAGNEAKRDANAGAGGPRRASFPGKSQQARPWTAVD